MKDTELLVCVPQTDGGGCDPAALPRRGGGYCHGGRHGPAGRCRGEGVVEEEKGFGMGLCVWGVGRGLGGAAQGGALTARWWACWSRTRSLPLGHRRMQAIRSLAGEGGRGGISGLGSALLHAMVGAYTGHGQGRKGGLGPAEDIRYKGTRRLGSAEDCRYGEGLDVTRMC